MEQRVLVVDDSATIRRVVSAVLAAGGYQVATASDGAEALDRVQRERYDLVLVDFVMPRLNGFQLAQAMRSIASVRDVPVLLMSARAEAIAERFVASTGAAGWIAKPFTPDALRAAVAAALIARPAPAPSDARELRDTADSVDALEDDDRAEEGSSVQPVPRRGSAPAPGVALEGRLDVFPLGDVVRLLISPSRTHRGVLSVSRGAAEVSVALRDGRVDGCVGRGLPEEFRIGRYLVGLGFVAREAVEEAAALRSDALLGERLVDAATLTAAQVARALARQSGELLFEALRWGDGRFRFEAGAALPPAERARLGIPAEALVSEGLRRAEVWRTIEAQVPSAAAVLARADEARVRGTQGLDREERRVLELIDGARPVREVARLLAMSSFEVCGVLMKLLRARVVVSVAA